MGTAALAAGTSQPWATASGKRDEWIRLRNWLVVWVVIANTGFASLWFIGAPPRYPEILAAGLIGLVLRHRPRWQQFVGFCGALAFSVLHLAAATFGLSITSVLHSFKFLVELNPAQSQEYGVVAAALAVSVVLAWHGLKRAAGFTDSRVVVAAMVALSSWAALDAWMTWDVRGHYMREPTAGALFSSATGRSGLDAPTGATRNVMVVMVESLGLPANNPEMERLLFARYRSPEVAARFELSRGETTYYNSTTAGEIRELCGRWGDYYDLLDRKDEGCLPARLRAQGFETSAYHSFTGGFFDRTTWYPNIGFDNLVFGPDLAALGAQDCGGVFAGVCDRDVPRLLASRLKQAERPQFVYWLTVNTHLPVAPRNNLDADACERISPRLAADYPMICRQFAIWDSIDAALVREITAADFPPTDILLVGDHIPPYFDRHSRSQFVPDKVPWLLLRWKGGADVPSHPIAAGAPRRPKEA